MFKLYLKILIFLLPILALYATAYFLYTLDIPYYNNDVVRQYQMEKLDNATEKIDTVFVGDSSLGRGLNAELFSELSERPARNLALSGSYGLVGALNMVKQARVRHPGIKNVVFVQSLNGWSIPFAERGYFKTSKNISTDDIPSDLFPRNKAIERLIYMTDLKRIYRFLKYTTGQTITVEERSDFFYTIQGEKTFHDGERTLTNTKDVEWRIDPSKKQMFRIIDDYCAREDLNCIYMHGPIHEDILPHVNEWFFDELDALLESATHITAVQHIFAVPNEHMGNTIEHVHISYKDEMTQRYYEAIQDKLE